MDTNCTLNAIIMDLKYAMCINGTVEAKVPLVKAACNSAMSPRSNEMILNVVSATFCVAFAHNAFDIGNTR